MSVASGGSASSLTERARAASSSSRPDDDATLRFNRVDGGGDGRKGAIPVYVMLPLDTVSRDGRLQRVDALSAQLARLASAGVAGGVLRRTRRAGFAMWVRFTMCINITYTYAHIARW